jgi:hypothetical protein
MVKAVQELRGFRSPMGSPVYYHNNQSWENLSLNPESVTELDSTSESSAVIVVSPKARRGQAKKKLKGAAQGVLFTKPAIFKKNICGDLFGNR